MRGNDAYAGKALSVVSPQETLRPPNAACGDENTWRELAEA